jgi:hypothetical protein
MQNSKPSPGIEGLAQLFNAEKKSEARKICRRLQITDTDLFHWILAAQAGALNGYRYANVHSEYMPVRVTQSQLDDLGNNGVGPLTVGARKAANVVGSMYDQRRLFSAHIFYNRTVWHMIYFDQRDMQESGNHWEKGTHVHYSRETYTSDHLLDVLEKLKLNPPEPPPGEHLRMARIDVELPGTSPAHTRRSDTSGPKCLDT